MTDFKTLKLTRKPNQFLMAPMEMCGAATPHADCPEFPIPASELVEKLHEIVTAEDRVTVKSRDPERGTARYVQRSKLFRFPDIIDIQVIDLGENKSAFAAYSRAVYGYRDFGVNRNRISRWVGKLIRATGGTFEQD